MSYTRPFPAELLAEAPEARLTYFKSKIIFHPKLKAVHHRLLRAIKYRPASLVMVIGPTGVGKTTLRLRVEEEVRNDAQNELQGEPNPGQLPIAGIAAAASTRGGFEWKDFFVNALEALNEPLISRKNIPYLRPAPTSPNLYLPGFEPEGVAPRLRVAGRANVLELRLAFEQALNFRQTRAFIIDEAQHLKQLASGRRLLDQMDNLKTLANNTNVAYVLIGTYELLDLTNLSGQLSRRSIDLHFSRYRTDNTAEAKVFENILYNFQQNLPLSEPPDLVSHFDQCYELTAGCVGLLKDWLTDALAEALMSGKETLSWHEIREYAPEERKRHSIALEIERGERRLAASSDGTHQAEIRRLLGMPPLSPLSPLPPPTKPRLNAPPNASLNASSSELAMATLPPVSGAVSVGANSEVNKPLTQSGRATRRVGQRNPVRDKVGRGTHE